MIKTIKHKVSGYFRDQSRRRKMQELFAAGLPEEMRPALEYLVSGHRDADTVAVARLAEGRRDAIAGEGDRKIPIWYSPKPGSAEVDDNVAARPEPGEVLEFTMERIARTGKDVRWGTALYLLARGFGSTAGIELGTCAGISAIYLASAPTLQKLITVEGSAGLAEIARESLKDMSNAQVVNSLFDDAIDAELVNADQKLDFAYIDGHHEKIATIHYFNRIFPYLQPGALVVFDDVSWSQDMRDAWDELSNRPEFSSAMDLGSIGVCILKTDTDAADAKPQLWNLQPAVGEADIGNPRGWSESE